MSATLFDELIALLGERALLSLIEAKGGRRFYVPEKAAGSQLEGIVGPKAAGDMVSFYGRGWLTIPLARRWRVAVYRTRGLTYPQIAEKLGITEDWAQKLGAKTGATPVSKPRRKPRKPPSRQAQQLELLPPD